MINNWKSRVWLLFGALVILPILTVSVGVAQDAGDKANHTLSKTAVWQPEEYQILNINNLWTWARRNGRSGHSAAGDYGTFFPRGKTYIAYQDGFVFGSKAYVDEAHTQPAPYSQTIRVGGATYGTGYQPGWVTGFGASAQRVAIDDPRARMYRIRRDWKEMPEDEVRRDAAESNETPLSDVTDEMVQLILDQYEESWNLWPVDLGAPFIDRNGDGDYDPPPADFTVKDLSEMGYDEPGVAGADPDSPADQVLFTIYNDLHRATSLGRFRSEPTGLEVQETVWGYKRTGPLGNMYFRKWRFINKGGVEIDANGTLGAFYLDSMYVVQWADMTNGDYTDDCLGCDSTLSMGYVWNGNAIDRDFRAYNLPPAAGGFDYLQGPVVPAPGERAVFDLEYRDDLRNLPMSGFSYFSAASAYSDPGGAYDTNTLRWYKMMRGYAPIGAPDEDIRYNFPPGVTPGNFPLAGDPTNTSNPGHIDCQGTTWSIQPGDRRLVMVSGPFQMAPGDTNEAVIAFVTGLGADRLSSISVMKFNDRFAQNTYDALFQVPSAPAPPIMTAAELDGRVILEWASDLERVADTEDAIKEPGGFQFEGYNLYQVPGPTAGFDDAVRIATFDRITDPAVVLDEQFDVTSGQILPTPVQYGTNSGIQRKFVFDRDYLLDVAKLNNGVDYYLAVTAYSVSTVPGFLPQSLESPLQIIPVVPKVPFGTEYALAYGDTVAANHSLGGSDGSVYPIVVDPTALNGHDYEVSFTDVDNDGVTEWTLRDVTANSTLIEGGTNQTGDDNYLFTDGFQLRVVGAPLDFKQFSVVANANGPVDPPDGGASDFSGFPSIRPTDAQQVGAGHWMIHTGDNGSRGSYSAFLSRSARGDNFSRLIPYDWEMRFTATGGYAAWDVDGPIYPVPFELWNIGINTPDDPSDDYRLIPLLLDNDSDGTFNLSNADHSASGGSDDPYTDWVYWQLPLDTSPGTAGYDAWEAALDLTNMVGPQASFDLVGDEVLARTVLMNWNGGDAPPYNQDLPETGTVFRINTTKPNSTNDVFTFTSPAPETNNELERISADKVGVFPNPYHAYNELEVDKLGRFVTFNNLPQTATIRIFTVSGHMVRIIDKSNTSQFQRWDLLNQSGLPVASGIYIAHIEMPDVGVSKYLKLAIVMEAEILDIF